MSRQISADVIELANRGAATVMRCLESVLENDGSVLRRLIVIDDHHPEPRSSSLNSLSSDDLRESSVA